MDLSNRCNGNEITKHTISTVVDALNFSNMDRPGCQHNSVNANRTRAASTMPATTFHTSRPCSNGLSEAVKENPEIFVSQEVPPVAAKSNTQEPSVQPSASNAAVDAASVIAAEAKEMAITIIPYRNCPNRRHRISGA